MLSKLKYFLFYLIILISFFTIFNFSCSQKEKYIGKYIQLLEVSNEQITNFIELKENHLGVWKVSDDEVPFSWTVNHNEIRLHMKSGGVIIGNIRGDVVEIALPGRGVMHFKKTK